ncbi:MAG TPA: carbohydrate binding domain-containing protein [Opitutaceae bacterium]|nr:carbohydrate binding domain-containing protein [Opitutaceae bacterium]
MKNPFSKISLLAFACFTVVVAAANAPLSLLKPAAKIENWDLEQHDGAKAAVKLDDDAIAVTVEAITGTDWNVQLIQAGLDLKEGKSYEVSFKAKASVSRAIQVYAGVAEDDYHAIGLDEFLSISKNWTEFRSVFKAENVAAKNNNRLGFLLGQEKGTVWLKDVTLVAK